MGAIGFRPADWILIQNCRAHGALLQKQESANARGRSRCYEMQ